LNGIGLAASLDFAWRGGDALLAGHLQSALDFSSLVSPFILFFAILTRAKDRLPGYPYLIASQLTMMLGFVGYLVREYTTWLGYTPWLGIISTWSLPLEAVFWAVALSTRYRYLDALAKDKMLHILEEEERRIRREVALSNVSRNRALAELNTHYQALSVTHDALVAIFDGATHACRGIAQKLAITIQRLARKSGADVPWQDASDMLATLMDEVEKLSKSAIHAVDKPTPTGALDDYLRWQLSIVDNEWRVRALTPMLVVAEDVPPLIVDGTSYAIVVREMLSNVSRYAAPESTVDIQLSRAGNKLQLSVENDGVPSEDRLAQIGSDRLSPATNTYNEEVSTGHGLYTTSRLLSNRGGSLKAEAADGRRFRLTASFPLLN
jgi:two-component sensor histidine kinase